MLRALELDDAAHLELAAYCRGKGIEFISSPFSVAAVRLLADEIGVARIKIPSGEIDNPLLPSGIERLLEEAALQSEQDELDREGGRGEKEDAVALMTIHASKGLEFDAIFITGLEQGLLPSERISDTDRDPEEERRLFYVALTRARKNVFLSYANARMKYGSREYTVPSEFLGDIDERLIEHARPRGIEKEHTIT